MLPLDHQTCSARCANQQCSRFSVSAAMQDILSALIQGFSAVQVTLSALIQDFSNVQFFYQHYSKRFSIMQELSGTFGQRYLRQRCARP